MASKTYPASPNGGPVKAITELLTNLPPGHTISLTKLPTGDISVTTVVEPKTKQCLLQEKYADLIGAPITLTEAAEKYQVPRHAIRDWVYQAKYIRFVDTASYPQKIDEAEVALCRDIYNDRKQTGLTGIPFFDEDGYVITERKNEKLAEYRRRKKALG